MPTARAHDQPKSEPIISPAGGPGADAASHWAPTRTGACAGASRSLADSWSFASTHSPGCVHQQEAQAHAASSGESAVAKTRWVLAVGLIANPAMAPIATS